MSLTENKINDLSLKDFTLTFHERSEESYKHPLSLVNLIHVVFNQGQYLKACMPSLINLIMSFLIRAVIFKRSYLALWKALAGRFDR